MDMNRAYFLKKEGLKPKWHLIDANGLVVGRLATKVATMLRGKHRVTYTPHCDADDHVVIINAKNLVLTGNKLEDKVYEKYTGYIGNKKYITAKQMMAKDPSEIIYLAIKRMLPRNKQTNSLLKNIRIYADASHPHAAQLAGFKD